MDFTQHPCFNEDVKGRFGRIHLPVAPKCNVQCNFCNRKYDCVNESRPGVSSQVLSPEQAAAYLADMKKSDPRLAVAGIAGPGDPFANPEETMQTLRLVREAYPEMLLCVATNGLAAAPWVREMADLKVSHLTITINAVDPAIGEKIYAWIRDGNTTLRGYTAATLLLERQLELLRSCKAHDIAVKVNSILIPDINDDHIVAIAKHVAEAGADLFNCIGMCRAEGAPFGDLPEPDAGRVCAIRREAERFLPQMKHCTRCRADAVGCLGDALPMQAIQRMHHYANGPLRPHEHRPYIAAATREGHLVNVHLGQAERLHIFRPDPNGDITFVQTRPVPPPGGGDRRWQDLSDLLQDCHVLLVANAGPSPTQILRRRGVKVICTDGLIVQAIRQIVERKTVSPPCNPRRCGVSCSGNAQGCA